MPRKTKAEKPPDPNDQVFDLYSGKVKIYYRDSSHRYKVSDNGEKPRQVPSVTTILNVLNKPALLNWAVRCACDYMRAAMEEKLQGSSFSIDSVFKIIDEARNAHIEIKETAAEIGVSAHDWLCAYWKGYKTGVGPPLPEEGKVRNCINAALDWFQQHDIKPLSVEMPVYSRVYEITGRPDFIGWVDGQFCIIDYKSTKALYPEIWLQMAAYASMHGEEFGQIPYVRWGLRLDKESGEFEARKLDKMLDEDFDTFLAAFKLYDRMKHLRRVPKPEPKSIEEELLG